MSTSGPQQERRTYANDALRSNELDELVGDGALGVALAVGLDVSEITNVALLVGRGTVGLAVGVDYKWKSVPSASIIVR